MASDLKSKAHLFECFGTADCYDQKRPYIHTPTRWFVTTRHDMAAILVQLLVSALLLLLLVTNGASSARPHPPPASAGEAPKAPRISSTLAEEESEAGASRKRVPPSGPSNKGHGSPESSTRHLLHLHADHGCAGRQRFLTECFAVPFTRLVMHSQCKSHRCFRPFSSSVRKVSSPKLIDRSRR
nr:PREDICTED: uncharacterized protein LOC103998168 isoform X2 [Musa acuminata subsp. malaccensis]